MLELEDYDNSSIDTKETELIDVKYKKDENFPIKNDINKPESSFNKSMEQMNSLIVKEKPLTNKYPNIKPKNRQGNTVQYFFDEKGSPKIVIGPHCKKKYYYISTIL